eukprot:CAMPEP_0172572804 /NCGR_PEP_ID=MMETSP1067-20121228/135867_1 /TAXON_ID=265564 ORGANISM="Thalassiosira punctigera, Strain Tpunct2005C2" /NCGR_SAMPLE_ID=MMETSP1067 /ASSEMBLY_ACC=CAM_ASM_000444 /LENGTH=432 /DNA_ID=CAMNT_0013365395 /DNA_START=1330 /DNA_END=2628 /DNA_ORIENTATION=-
MPWAPRRGCANLAPNPLSALLTTPGLRCGRAHVLLNPSQRRRGRPGRTNRDPAPTSSMTLLIVVNYAPRRAVAAYLVADHTRCRRGRTGHAAEAPTSFQTPLVIACDNTPSLQLPRLPRPGPLSALSMTQSTSRRLAAGPACASPSLPLQTTDASALLCHRAMILQNHRPDFSFAKICPKSDCSVGCTFRKKKGEATDKKRQGGDAGPFSIVIKFQSFVIKATGRAQGGLDICPKSDCSVGCTFRKKKGEATDKKRQGGDAGPFSIVIKFQSFVITGHRQGAGRTGFSNSTHSGEHDTTTPNCLATIRPRKSVAAGVPIAAPHELRRPHRSLTVAVVGEEGGAGLGGPTSTSSTPPTRWENFRHDHDAPIFPGCAGEGVGRSVNQYRACSSGASTSTTHSNLPSPHCIVRGMPPEHAMMPSPGHAIHGTATG